MKLLQKVIRGYFIYSVFTLVVAIPIFYLVIQAIVKEDIDESLATTEKMILPKIRKALENNAVDQLNFLDHDIRLTKVLHPPLSDSLYAQIVYDSLSRENTPYRFLIVPITVKDASYSLQIAKSLVDNEDLIESIVKVQALLLLALLGGLFLINRQLSRRIMRPFYNTLRQLRDYKVARHEPLLLESSSIEEFDALNNSLKELTERNYTAYISQKEFAENASHEMQTPLAIFQGKLELLMQTNPLNQEQAELMGDLADASQRMNRLNKSLVLLTKIENNQFPDRETLSLKSCVEKFILLYEPQMTHKNIKLNYSFYTNIAVEANKAIFEILIGNLLGNAIRHNHPNGSIHIKLEGNELLIQNSGKPTPLDPEKIFKRFQKDSADNSGTGLGLEMVKKICCILNCQVNYGFHDGWHRFTLHFPEGK